MNYDELLSLARSHPVGRDLPGFDNRLRSRLRELRSAEDTAGLFARWLWGASWGLAPVAAALAIGLFASQGLSMPVGAESVLVHLAPYLPESTW